MMAGRTGNDEAYATRGTLLAAHAVVEALGGREDHRQREEVWAEVRSTVDYWGVERMTDAFGALMVIAMGACGDDGDDAIDDVLRAVVPAVVSAFRRLGELQVLDRWLPTVVGALTAAALGRDPYEWRSKLGPLQPGEPLNSRSPRPGWRRIRSHQPATSAPSPAACSPTEPTIPASSSQRSRSRPRWRSAGRWQEPSTQPSTC